ncbi:hypothetical protein BKA57DRAFT_444218 [Linnemannia elongata]|nr:hypothetical protein BKA57DRAFT_444218 [Linnemannia elongata]
MRMRNSAVPRLTLSLRQGLALCLILPLSTVSRLLFILSLRSQRYCYSMPLPSAPFSPKKKICLGHSLHSLFSLLLRRECIVLVVDFFSYQSPRECLLSQMSLSR